MLLIFSNLSPGGGEGRRPAPECSLGRAVPGLRGRTCARSPTQWPPPRSETFWLWQWCEELASSPMGREKKPTAVPRAARKAPLLCFLLFSNKIGKETVILGTLLSFRCECQQRETYLWLYFSGWGWGVGLSETERNLR